MSADSPAVILYNQDGYPVGVTYDGVVYRLQVDTAIAPGTSVLNGRAVPSDPTLIVASKLINGSSSNMLVDGSSTPAEFKYNADPIKDIRLSELRLVLVANSLSFIGSRFGAISALTNGVKIEVKSNGVLTTLATLNINEDFLLFHSTNAILVNESGPKDVIAAGYLLGGAVVLKAGTDDYLGVVIRDNLTHPSFAYFQATGYGIKDA
jgi:hypothetical protein